MIPYYSTADKKMRNYYMDFIVKLRTSAGIKTIMIEIKPYNQTIPPTKTGRKAMKTFLTEKYTYDVNMDKWKHAKEYAKARGWEFHVMTEKELYSSSGK